MRGEAVIYQHHSCLLYTSYNHFLDARDCGILLVEAGHYDTEKTFVEAMKEGLQNYCNRVQYNIAVIASEYGSRPYSVY